MVAVHSTMMPLGTKAPSFSLPDAVTGEIVDLASFEGRDALLVMFICNHCPYVKHVRGELARLGREYAARGVGLVAISANDVDKYPEDAPPAMKAEATEAGYTFPYLFDETQEVAKAYGAACTPDFYVFDREQALAYRGQLDDSRPSNGKPVTGRDLRAALDALLSGGRPSLEQVPSIGCNIKWKAGNAPHYFG